MRNFDEYSIFFQENDAAAVINEIFIRNYSIVDEVIMVDIFELFPRNINVGILKLINSACRLSSGVIFFERLRWIGRDQE